MDEPLLILFSISAGAWILFIIIGAFIRHSPKRSKRLDELKAKEKKLETELKQISIKQVIALNSMLDSNVIDQVRYESEMNDIYRELKRLNIDPSFLEDINPGSGSSPERLAHGILTTASVLEETGNLNAAEFEKYINSALDLKNQIRNKSD